MAVEGNEQDPKGDDEHLDIDDDEAQKLLADAVDEDDDDPAGADQLGDAGKRALDAIKEQRKAARTERDKYKTELAEARAKLQQHDDKDKTEAQRLQEAADSYKTRAERAEAVAKRREIAEESAPDHATIAQIKAVAKRLTGESDEDLEKDAEELFALIAPAPAGGDNKPTKTQQPGKPKANLRGGGDPSDGDDETDPRKLAALIPRNR